MLSIGNGMHRECILSNGGGNALIARNWFNAGSWADLSGEVCLFGDFSQIHDVTIDSNVLMQSGSYQLYAGSISGKQYPTAINIAVTNNRFGPAPVKSPGPGAQYGNVSGWKRGGGNVWSGNTKWDGSVLNEP
jgi:hypothetical protein